MSYQETCHHCGHVNTAYAHTLNTGLVQALRQLVDYYHRNKRAVKSIQSELELTKNQFCNFQKLQYFDLARKTPFGWFPSDRGVAFIQGELQVEKTVATIASEVLPYEHPYWRTKAYPTPVYVWQIDEKSYKRRTEYQFEKSKQTVLSC